MENETPENIDLEKGVITLKKGEETKSFKLNDKEDLGNLVKLGQRGWYFDEEASVELGDLRKVIKNWDSAIEAARNNDEALKGLVQKLELAVGRPLTAKEQQQVEEGKKPRILIDEEEDERLQGTIKALKDEIEQLKRSQADSKRTSEEAELARLQQEILKEASALEKKYPGENGTPKFEQQKVINFAAENNIADLELAFKMMNFDKLTEKAKSDARTELKKQLEDRRAGFTETGEGITEPLKPPKKTHKTYHQLGKTALKEAEQEGISFFKSD